MQLLACADYFWVHSPRLDAIAADAGLLEKSLSDLESLAAMLHDGCVEAESYHQERLANEAEGELDETFLDCTPINCTFSVSISWGDHTIGLAHTFFHWIRQHKFQ